MLRGFIILLLGNLANPKKYIDGKKTVFPGMKKENERADLVSPPPNPRGPGVRRVLSRTLARQRPSCTLVAAKKGDEKERAFRGVSLPRSPELCACLGS